jgi:beta-lactamase class A
MLSPVLRRRPWVPASILLLALALAPVPSRAGPDWTADLRERLERLDRNTPGELGVYVKRLDTGQVVGHGADRGWYLGSSAKVPIAITVLRQVDAGKLSLATQVTLQETDRIDGPGELVWARAGSRYTIDSLLTRMLGVSDNTAANLLVRTVGEDALNQVAADLLGKGVRLTSLTEVRRQVYAQIHPDAARLPNRVLVTIAGEEMGPRRFEAVRRALDLPAGALKVRTIGEAYDRFYDLRLNTATLEGYGSMLERLVRGQLLGAQSTRRLFGYLKFGKRGDYRLEGGIPKREPIIHKTGTQHRRACHMLVVNPQEAARAVVIATCAADMDDVKDAGGIFRRVGEAVSATTLVRPRS